MNNKGTDQTAPMRRLVCVFVVPKQQSQGFSRRGHMILKPRLSALRLAMHLKANTICRLCSPSVSYKSGTITNMIVYLLPALVSYDLMKNRSARTSKMHMTITKSTTGIIFRGDSERIAHFSAKILLEFGLMGEISQSKML